MNSKTYHIKLNGKVYEVEIEEVTQQENVKNEVIEKKEENTIKNNTQNDKSSSEEIVAPMPGNIFNILVKQGQKVKKGDVVAVLEAMKMENEILAPVDGEVLSVDVEKGQNVSLGDIILKIA